MWELGARLFVEVGPSEVLSGLVRRTVEPAQTLAVHTAEDVQRAVKVLSG